MNFKRFMTMLLAVCLVLNMVIPGVSAVMPGADSMAKAPAPEAAKGEPVRVTTLRDSARPAVTAQDGEGKWTFEKVSTKPGVDLFEATLPKGVQELRDAADLYEAEETVAAYIILEDAPLSEGGYSTMSNVPAAKTEALLNAQNKLIQKISKSVLGGKKLDVRHQFTYLTNAVSANVPFGKLDEIAKLDGVKTVILMPVYAPAVVDTKTTSAVGMIGAPTVWENLGYTGEGMKIAVVDTGLDLDHPSFAAAPALTAQSMTVEDVEAVLSQLNASALYPQASAADLYRSEKVPFAFNYVDENLKASHDYDQQGDHGTHVAGIAAANDLPGSGVIGVAPDAQVIVMKVFGANGGAYHDDMMLAIEDALLLNVDVINMSLGGTSGFSSEDPELDEMYNRVNDHDVVLAISAGNEGTSASGNLWGTDLNPTAHPDTAVVGSPSTYGGALSIASAENAGVVGPFLTVAGEDHGYSDALGLYVEFRALAGQELEYVMVPGLGNAADFEGLDVAGKVAVISRGEINFSLKLFNAEQAGAIGCIIYNNQPGTIGLQMTDDNGNLNDGISGEVPCVSVTQETGVALAEAAEKKLTISEVDGLVPTAEGGQMSTFSSWGVTPSLELKPEITAVGGNIYSCYDNGQYGIMSGTSMSAPQLSGAAALVLQYLENQYPGMFDMKERDVAQALLMSTADPIISNASGVEASPRQQGAGLVNVAAALNAEAYLTVPGESKAKAELGDDPAKTGKYTFSFDIHNMSLTDKTYTFDASLLTEDVVDYGAGLTFMADQDRALSGKVSFSEDTVTVHAGLTARVDVTIELSAEDMAWMDKYYENGIYVEGFVYAKDAEGEDLNLPFLGFYGDWTAAPIMDTAFWTDQAFMDANYQGLPTGNQYFTIAWTNLGSGDFVLGYNPYTGNAENYDANKHNVLSPNGDGVLDSITELYVSLMRNARTLDFIFTDATTGEVLFESNDVYARKSSFVSAYGQIVPYVYSNYNELYNFTDANGNLLKNNTRLNLTVAATGDYDVHTEDLTGDSWSIPVLIDTQAPVLIDVKPVATLEGNSLELTFRENFSIADVFVMNATNTRILAEEPNAVDNGDGTFTVTMDVTGLGNEFLVIGCDYGANEATYAVTFTEDDNLPELEAGAVYAYRVSDDAYTDDTLYGWVTIDPATAEVTTLTTDVMEYYALTAAEYAGGYIFAVDAGYNLVALEPGVWTRTEICNLGVSIADMSFDAATNTMYMVGKTEGTNKLFKLDLATGEYEIAWDLGTGTVYSIEFAANGDLYAVKGSSAKLWKMNWETGELEAVIEFVDGEYPYYSQSMTYDADNNCLYWAYCTYKSTGFAIYTINLEDMTYTKADLSSNAEFVGMLMIDDKVEIPACDGTDCPSTGFEDLEADAWYHEGVDYVLLEELMKGISETEFAPVMTTNRATALTVLYRMAGAPDAEGETPFVDVVPGSFYEKAVQWGYQNGIVNGRTAQHFCPNEAVNRQELVTFLYRFAAYMDRDVTSHYDSLIAFVDASEVNAFALPAMKWAVAEGLIDGVGGSHLAPLAESNRAQLATLLLRLHKNVTGGFHVPGGKLSALKLAPESILLGVGASQAITVTPAPWNAQLGELTFTSSDETVATVSQDGMVTGVAGGECVIVVSCGELSAELPVRVVDVKGTIHAYSYYSDTLGYGNWLTMDLANLDSVTLGAVSPVDFIAADYNGHDDLIYGFDSNYNLYSWNQDTNEVVNIGSAGASVQVTDMAYDYSTGAMYAVGVDMTYYVGGLYQVNTRTGELVQVALSAEGLAFFGLAIDLNGNMYTLDSESNFYRTSLQSAEDWFTGETVTQLVSELLCSTGFGGLTYTQSICYDHNNDQIIWATCGGYSTIYWIDPATGAFLDIGAPGGDPFFEFIGLHAVPETIPERPFVTVENADLADTLVVMEGGVKAAPLNLKPVNATIETVVWSVADESVATVSQSGAVTGVSKGETTVTVAVTSGENTFTDTMTVKVLESADNMYAFLMTDVATMGGDIFIGIDDTQPEYPAYLNGVGLTFNGMEYYDGLVYGYGYDPNDWEVESNTFVAIDPADFTIVSAVDSGSDHFIYDMAYDYATATMYALAGYGETAPDLYMVNMDTGRLIMVADLEGSYKSLAIDKDGTAYVTDSADAYEDPETWEYVFPNSKLYTLNLATGETTLIGDTGMKNNMFSTMAFDFDTGNLYWNTVYRMDIFSPLEAKLCVVDVQTGAATALGTIGTNGSQITGLFCIADNYPEEPETTLTNVTISERQKLLSVGDTTALEAWAVHPSCGAALTWTSSDETVATVDENGQVTAVAPGIATVTVTATLGEIVVSDSCKVCVFAEDASFLAFSDSDMAWGTVGRMDPTVTTTGIAGDAVSSAAYVGDAIYGYDGNNQLFVITDESTMERTVIGGTGLDFDKPEGVTEDGMLLKFEIRGMGYDKANERMLVLGVRYQVSEWGSMEIVGGGCLYEADLSTGALTYLVTVDSNRSQYRGMAVAPDGTVYIYNAFDDNFSIVNMNDGSVKDLFSSQTVSLYGDTDSIMPMAYDETTGLIYVLMTTNGSFYQMVTLDPATATFTVVGRVGNVVYDEDAWAYVGPTYKALLIK